MGMPMQLNQVKKDAVILADTYLHNEIRMALLKQQQAVSNVTVLSLPTYLERLQPRQAAALLYEYYTILSKLPLTVFKDIVKTGDFLDEILSFVNDLKCYQIDVATLPERDHYQQELKIMVEALMDVVLPVDEQMQLLGQLEDFTNFYIVDYAPTLFREMLYAGLEQKGAIRLAKASLQPHKEFYYVLNKREEVEALARYIVTHQIDVETAKLTLLNEEYEGFVRQIFDRYQIPYHFVSQASGNRLVFKYISLLMYYQNPSMQTLQHVLHEEVFYHPFMNDFIAYIGLFKVTLDDTFDHIRKSEISEDIVNGMEKKQLLRLEEHAQQVKQQIAGSLKQLEPLSEEAALLYVDELVNEHHIFSKLEDVKTIRLIREQMKEVLPFLNKVPLRLFIHKLKKVNVSNTSNYEGMSVSSLQQPLGNQAYHFILGANSDNYPKFPSLSGLFSERYVAGFGYPSLEKRYALHERNLQVNLQSSEQLVVFYATSSLSGKDKEAALEIENFMECKATYYPLPYNRKSYEMNTRLASATSKQLFYPESQFKGSITSYEMYSTCPFKYFVRHGLKIYEPTAYSVNSAKAGTLMHAVLEGLVQVYGKAYAEQTLTEVQCLLTAKVSELLQIYPYLQFEIKVIQERILFAMQHNLSFLKQLEEHTSLTPTKTEVRFDYELTFAKECLQLHGYVDRINENRDFFAIIDYKSSSKKLKEEEVFSGLKLQLITYLVAMSHQIQKRPIGAYYYSLGNKQQGAEYATYLKRSNEIVVLGADDYKDMFIKSKKLEGWSVSEDVKVMDQDLTFTNGIGYKKDGSYTAKTNIYHVDVLETVLFKLYEKLLQDIKLGNMDVIPTTCDFCCYGSICHYKGKCFEREVMAVDEQLYAVHKGKVEGSDGNVE